MRQLACVPCSLIIVIDKVVMWEGDMVEFSDPKTRVRHGFQLISASTLSFWPPKAPDYLNDSNHNARASNERVAISQLTQLIISLPILFVQPYPHLDSI